jgi:hypothetical protein
MARRPARRRHRSGAHRHRDAGRGAIVPDAGADKTGGARQARDQIATAAAHGDPGPLRQDLRVNCPPEWIRKGGR